MGRIKGGHVSKATKAPRTGYGFKINFLEGDTAAGDKFLLKNPFARDVIATVQQQLTEGLTLHLREIGPRLGFPNAGPRH